MAGRTPRPASSPAFALAYVFAYVFVLTMFFEEHEIERYSVRFGDVLICEGGEPGRAAVWDNPTETFMIQKAIHRVRLLGGIVPQWLVLNLRRDAWSGRLNQYFTGATIKHFTGKALSSYTFPLPPLPEQKRIVARVDHLMSLCDTLEAALRQKQETAAKLVEAVVSEICQEAPG